MKARQRGQATPTPCSARLLADCSTAPDDISQALSQRIVQGYAGKSSDKHVLRKLAGTAKKK